MKKKGKFNYWNQSSNGKGIYKDVVRVFSDVLVSFLYFDICHYGQSNLAIENPEFSQPVVAGHFQ